MVEILENDGESVSVWKAGVWLPLPSLLPASPTCGSPEDFAGSAWFWRVRGAQKANKNETAKKSRIWNFFHFSDQPWSWFLISSKPQFHLWTLSLISPSIVTSFYLFYTLLLYSSGLPFGDKYEHANTNTTMEVNKYKSTNTISHTNLEMQQRAVGAKVVIKFYKGVTITS